MIKLSGAVTLSVNGRAARVVAAERQIVVEMDDPRAFLRACGVGGQGVGGRGAGSSPLATLRQAGATLAAAGLTVRVVSRGSPLVTLGRDARPGLAQALTGSPHVAPGSPLGLLRLLGPS